MRCSTPNASEVPMLFAGLCTSVLPPRRRRPLTSSLMVPLVALVGLG